MEPKEFEESVKRALLMLPDQIRDKMENLAVCVHDDASTEQLKRLGMRCGNVLLGLYEGIPMNAWGRGRGNNLPDKITIFRIPIEKMASDSKEMEELIRDVVWHEVAHHFGFDEREISKMERKWRSRRKNL